MKAMLDARIVEMSTARPAAGDRVIEGSLVMVFLSYLLWQIVDAFRRPFRTYSGKHEIQALWASTPVSV